MTSRSVAATRSRSGFSASSTDASTLHLHLPPTPPKYARHWCAYFDIILSAGCGGESPVAGAIGWELGGRSPSSPPPAASSLALFRCISSSEILAAFIDMSMCLRKARPLGRVFRVTFMSRTPSLQKSANRKIAPSFYAFVKGGADYITGARKVSKKVCAYSVI